MFDLKELRAFLVEASLKTYATGDEKLSKKETDGSTTYLYEKGKWKYHDNFVGAEPFGGREIIFYEDTPVWMMTYYGGVSDKQLNKNEVFSFLQKALSKVDEVPEEAVPCRGPKNFKENEYKYLSNTMGQLEGFTGEEFILKDGSEIYCTVYSGGLIGS
ncbi:MAG: hypothetical protein Fur003_0720 [Candidatus Dojkabacteria bacterium]